jgi:hypothetical protein
MVHERWSPEDSAERRARIEDADARLDAWAKWSRVQSGLGSANSNWFMALNPAQPEEQQAGAKHVAECCPDEEALEVDAILARWKTEEPAYWKIVRKEYLSYGAQESKARSLGLSRAFYRLQLDELRAVMWRALDLAAKKRTKPCKLASLPAKTART